MPNYAQTALGLEQKTLLKWGGGEAAFIGGRARLARDDGALVL